MNEEIKDTVVATEEDEKRLVGVRFRPCGKVYTYDAGELDLSPGDEVVVESMFGLTIGTVITLDPDFEGNTELKTVIRKATEEDFKAYEENRSLEKEAREFCLERIHARGLPMKLVGTEVTLDRKRIIFYFTADGRIDFRELVKDLAAKFRTRIEMRQIGVRDEAKMLGGIGICGRQLCCNSFLSNFAPISIRMAKDQELVLNTAKLTGLCGRLMCCLSYEHEGPIEEGVDETLDVSCLCEECPREDLVTEHISEPVPEEALPSVKGDEPQLYEREKPPMEKESVEEPVEIKKEEEERVSTTEQDREKPTLDKDQEIRKPHQEQKDRTKEHDRTTPNERRKKRFKKKKGAAAQRRKKKKKRRKGH